MQAYRSSHQEVLLRKSVLKICSKFTRDHPCRTPISVKLLCNFIEIALRHGCSPVNLLHIFRIPFPRNTSVWLLLNLVITFLPSLIIRQQLQVYLKDKFWAYKQETDASAILQGKHTLY